MKDFETKLAELKSQQKRTSSKLEKKEILKARISLLQEGLIETEDISSFLKIVAHYFKKPAKAIAGALDRLPETKKKSLLDCMKSNYKKALTYQLVAQLLVQEKILEGIDLLTHCCDLLTEGSKKEPEPDIREKIELAMFQAPSVEEKPLIILLDNNLSMSVLICLLYVVFYRTNSIGQDKLWAELRGEPRDEKKDKLYIFIKYKLFLQSSKIWAELDAKQQKIFENIIGWLPGRKTIRDIKRFYLDDGLKNPIFDKFIKAIKPKEPKNLSYSELRSLCHVYGMKAGPELREECFVQLRKLDSPGRNVIKVSQSLSRINLLKKDFPQLHNTEKIHIKILNRPCVIYLEGILMDERPLGSKRKQNEEPHPLKASLIEIDNREIKDPPSNDQEKSQEQAIKDKLKIYKFYVYKNDLYCVDFEFYTEEEQRLLIKEYYFKKEKKFKSLQKEIHLFEKLDVAQGQSSREPIPEDVRFAVWRRDEGKCVKCGSKENLEFDHIIPVSKGGSNTERNIQLLCERCNREKYNKI